MGNKESTIKTKKRQVHYLILSRKTQVCINGIQRWQEDSNKQENDFKTHLGMKMGHS